MARRRKRRRNGNGVKYVGLVPLAITAEATKRFNMLNAATSVKGGDFKGALDNIAGGTTREDMVQTAIEGLAVGFARKAVGRIPLFHGKKWGVSVL